METPKPKAFNINLTEAERERLEQHRAAWGLRSQAEVIRRWIARPVIIFTGPNTAIGIDVATIPVDDDDHRARDKLDTATERVTFGPVDALTGEPLKPRRPMQKGKTK